jgi:putative endonuclease
MFYVYVLKSERDQKLYLGRTSDLKERFKQHNSGLSKATKNRTPFLLVYYEGYKSSKDASTRERRLKKFKNSYTELKKRIENSLEI